MWCLLLVALFCLCSILPQYRKSLPVNCSSGLHENHGLFSMILQDTDDDHNNHDHKLIFTDYHLLWPLTMVKWWLSLQKNVPCPNCQRNCDLCLKKVSWGPASVTKSDIETPKIQTCKGAVGPTVSDVTFLHHQEGELDPLIMGRSGPKLSRK